MDALHLLLTYACSRECPHCFVWGGPPGPTMTTEQVINYVDMAASAGMTKVAFEGGESFLHYRALVSGVRAAQARDLEVSIVTNASWACCHPTARRLLQPLLQLGDISLMISTDSFHGGREEDRRVSVCTDTARDMGVDPVMFRTGFADVMFRGRAAVTLAGLKRQIPWDQFTSCPHEDLLHPGRAHLDAAGFLHLCQGLCPGRVDGNLADLISPEFVKQHPLIPVIAGGGPAALVEEHELVLERTRYADACHLCYTVRGMLRPAFGEFLGPDRVYGDINDRGL